jgi:hypothetical protein
MHMLQPGKAAPKSALLLAACLFLLVACGSNTSTGATSSGTSATATACAQATRPATSFKTAIGVLASINGQALVLTNSQGKNVTVTYSSSTTFTQEVKLAPGDLKEGASVRVAVTSAGSSYTAASVLVSSGTATTTGKGGFGGFPGFGGTPGARKGTGTNPCSANRARFGNGTPGTGTGTNNFRGLVGTVSQVNGDILTITDTAGASYTVTLTAQTQIVETKSATAAVLKVGEPLTAVGKPGSQNAVAASTIAVLLSLPARGTPTSTPTV